MGPVTCVIWLWTFVGLAVSVPGAMALKGISPVLISKVIPLPAYIPAGLDPALRTVSQYRELMGLETANVWGICALIWMLMFFNTMGEELWWRGYIYPRQELAHGTKTWIIHFAMWTLFHVFEYFRWLEIIMVSPPLSYITHRTRSNWPAILIHGMRNLFDMAQLTLIVFGILV